MAGEDLFQNQRSPWLTATPTAAGSVTHPPDSGDVRISVDPTTLVMRIHDSGTSDWPVAALSKFDATVAPGVSNDDSEGYSPGSDWIDVTNDKAYKCLDASTGAAVWTETTAGGGAAFDPDVHMPRHIPIPIHVPASSNTNFNDTAIDGGAYGNYQLLSTGAINAEVNWNIPLSAGTWAIDMMYVKGNNRGIYSVQVDDSEQSTVDGYKSGSASYGNETSVTGITIGSTALHEISFKMLTKNASSSSYYGSLEQVALRRTA